jgi:hypothetical protein
MTPSIIVPLEMESGEVVGLTPREYHSKEHVRIMNFFHPESFIPSLSSAVTSKYWTRVSIDT